MCKPCALTNIIAAHLNVSYNLMTVIINYRKYLIVVILFLSSCATHKVSTLVGYDYDAKSNKTDYFILPYGSISIPGKWEKSNYNSISRQQFFKNEDSVTIAIAFGPCNKFEFNADNPKVGYEFVKAYYEWDSQYFVGKLGLGRKIIESDSLNSYLIWNLFGASNDLKVDTYFLFSDNNCYVKSFSVLETDKWTASQKVEFLKNLYRKEDQE